MPLPKQARSRLDLAAALVEHLLMAPLWLILSAGVGESIPMPETASTAWLVGGWSLLAVLPLTWCFLGAMLVIWWRKDRGPLWPYPLKWGLMLFLTFVALVALLFPRVRRSLAPPRLEAT